MKRKIRQNKFFTTPGPYHKKSKMMAAVEINYKLIAIKGN